jgi:aryl-alcohol dehydrogenase-like predicted oxidoreductase
MSAGVASLTVIESHDFAQLSGSEVRVPRLGVGTWAWGDKATWGMGGYDVDLSLDTIRGAWEASLAAGVTLFDTAEVYGKGESERIIGGLLREVDDETRRRIVIATKFMPAPWKVKVTDELMASLRRSLERLGVEAVDLYQLHGPVSLRGHSALADALAAAHEAGLVRAVGVSNYSSRETRSMDAALRARGLRLATNQVEYSLLRRKPETGGLLDTCAELGVLVLAYSPIGQGRLTGKYSAAAPPPGRRGFSAHSMEAVDRVVAVLRDVGGVHDRTPSQVALRWLIQKGAVPIPGAKNDHQATENAGALGWSLAADEMARLDAAALVEKRSVANRFWQHG